MKDAGLLEVPTARLRRHMTPVLVITGLALLTIAAFYLYVGLQFPDPDPMREPRLMLGTNDAPDALASQLEAIPGVAGVLPARASDLESMYLTSDDGWRLGATLVVQVEEGVDVGLLRDRLTELPGVLGYAERTDFGMTWRILDGSYGGAAYDRRGIIVYLWPLVFAVPGIVLLWLAWRRGHISGGSVPVA